MTPEVELHHEPHHEQRTRHRWVDWSVTGCALFVSFCSLGISIHHGHTMERLVQASSLPFLQFEYSDAERLTDGSFNTALLLEMDNAGAGAARVDWLRVTLNGKVVESWRTTLDALQRQMVASGELPAVVPLGAIIVGDFGAAFLKGGDKRQLLRWTRTDANAAFWDMGEQHLSNSKELVMQACYCSIFDQCWITSNRSFKPQSVESCSKEN